MSRYIKDVQLDQPVDTVSIIMEDFTYHNQFRRADWNGEMVYLAKDRHGRERYLKWSYVSGLFHAEAWLKTRFGGEMDLDGVGGGASREEYRKCMDDLVRTLSQQDASQITAGHMGSDPIHHDTGHGDNHAVWRADTRWQQEEPSSEGDSPLAGLTGVERELEELYQQKKRQQSANPNRAEAQQKLVNLLATVTEQRNAGSQPRQVKTQPMGAPTPQPWQQSKSRQVQGQGTNGLPENARPFLFAVFSVVFGLAAPFFGMVFGVMALREGGEIPKVKKMAIAGIVITVLHILVLIAMVFAGLFDLDFFTFF